MHFSRMHSVRHLSVSGEGGLSSDGGLPSEGSLPSKGSLPSERGLPSEGGGGGFCLLRAAFPWHCGKADPRGQNDRRE